MKNRLQKSLSEVIDKMIELNSLSSSKVIEMSVGFIKNSIKCKGAAFYLASDNGRYLRLVAKSYKDSNNEIIKSIDLDKSEQLKNIMGDWKIFINEELRKELSQIMIPIVIDNKTKAALAIYDMELDDINEDIDMIEILGKAVGSALINAYTYENAIEGDRYINNTGVLKTEYFKEIIENKEYFKKNNGAVYSLIKLSHKLNNDMEYLYYNLKSQLRGMDYIGIDESGELYLILSNTSHEEAKFVIERLMKRGFEAGIVENIKI